MKVILLEDIKGVGKKGQLLNASDGHARNYLLPKKLAVEATKANMNELEAKEKSLASKNRRDFEKAQKLSDRLKEKAVVISVKAGDTGKLYGSVTSREIAAALSEQTGIVIDKKKIVLPDTIKSTGEKQVSVKLHADVVAEITVDVKGIST
jgi:large subunit ribosomal protein L9